MGRLSGRLLAWAAVVAVGVVVLAGASVAQAAPKGVVGFFGGSGESGGLLTNPAGVGAYHSTGDVYVVDKSNNRVQRFSATGAFELAWGKDVVIAGRPGDAGTGFEVCSVADDCQGNNNNEIAALGRAPLGGELFEPSGIAIDQSDGSVYVSERQNRRVSKFTADGVFVLAWGKNVVRAGGVGDVATPAIVVNERQSVTLSALNSDFSPAPVTGGTFTLSFSGQTTSPIAYNATAAAVQSALEALSNIGPGGVAVTGPDGGSWTVEFVGARGGIDQPQMTGSALGLTTSGAFSQVTVATVQNGSTTTPGPAEICTVAADCREGDIGTLGAEFGDFGSNGAYPAVVPAGNPNAGNVIVADPGNRRVQEFTSSGQFVRAFGADVDSPAGGTAFEICTTASNCKIAAASGAGVGQFATSQPTRTAVDSTGAIYTVESTTNFRVQKFTPQAGPPALAPSVFLTAASNTAPTDVAVGVGDNVLISRASPAGASICPSGSPSPAERRVHEYTPAGAEIADSPHIRCAGISTATINGLGVNTNSGDIYATGNGGGLTNRVFVIGVTSVPMVSLGIGGVGSHTAQLNGLVNPGGPDTEIGIRTSYHFEYREIGSPTWIALSADKDAGNGFATVPVTETLTGLDANTPYEARLVASKPFSGAGNITTAPEAFITPASQPDIDSVYVTDREATTATLNARINPNGEATSYHFEYGPTAAYGTTIPDPDASAGSGTTTQIFSEAITSLAPNTTYHYRLIATSVNGTTTTADRTFTTRAVAPPPTGRAYELVSPADKIGGSGIADWYAGVGSHGNSGLGALDGDRYASQAYFGGSLADGGFSYGSDWTLGQRTPAGWLNKPFFNRPGGFGTSEFAKVVGIDSASEDLSLLATGSVSQISIFEEQPVVWAGVGIGSVTAPALREWDTDRWEILAPVAPDQLAGGLVPNGSSRLAAGGGYALVSGGIRGVAGPGDPTSVAFSGDPGDFDATGNGNVYIDDVTAGLSDSFPGDGIRSLVNVCTGTGAGRTTIPSIDAGGKIVASPCPDLPGRDARLISPRGASAPTATARGVISRDGSRVFFMSPDLKTANDVACVGAGPVDTKCPPQVYVRQRNADGSVMTRWISRSAVGGQAASLMATAVFEGATPDGDKAFFRTASPLTADDPNGATPLPGGVKSGTPNPSSVDLYMYDFPDAAGADPGTGTLTRVSAGPSGASDANVSTDSVTGNSAALRAFGEDGSRVYFATAAPLASVSAPASGTITTPGGTPSQAATRNLYLYDTNLPQAQRWRFIAQLPANSTLGGCAAKGSVLGGDGLAGASTGGGVGANAANNCVRPTADGSFLTLFTDGRLTADDPDSTTGDVYAYDATTHELTRLSTAAPGDTYQCVTGGALCHGDHVVARAETAHGTLNVITNPANGDRTAFFESASRLVAADQNDAYDVYQWRNGELSLVSTGKPGAEDALYRGNDRTGTNVYISTRDPLTWQDHDAVLDVYTARAGSTGIPQPPLPPACALIVDGCQGAGASLASVPGSETGSAPAVANARGRAGMRLAVGRLSAKARRAAARSGVLKVIVRTNRAGRVTAVAKARFGGRARRVARKSIRAHGAGKAVLRLRLSRAARLRLRDGRALGVTVRVTSPGAKARAMTVRLPGVKS